MDSSAVRRVASFCRLWGTLRYFHPYLAYRGINWDSAFVAAIPAVEASRAPGEYRAAITSLLAPLGDPGHRVLEPEEKGTAKTNVSRPRSLFTGDSVLVITIDDYASLDSWTGTGADDLRPMTGMIHRACGVVFDLRMTRPPSEDEQGTLDETLKNSGLLRRLSARPIRGPGQRVRMHTGYPPQEGSTSGGYTSAFCTTDGAVVKAGPAGRQGKVAFLVNQNSEIPAAALGLQSTGDAVIIAEGSAREGPLVRTHRFDAGEGIVVEFRLGELVYEDGTTGLCIDSTVAPPPAGAPDGALQAAVNLARGGTLSPRARISLPACAWTITDSAYLTPPYPSHPRRLLAAARIWVIFNYFFPYKPLMKEDWDGALERSLPGLAAARDSMEYALAVAELVARVHDSHAFIYSPALDQYFGTGRPPLVVRPVEGLPVVTSLLDDSVATACGVRVGDVVLEVDGERADLRSERFGRYVAASTPQALNRNVYARLLNGPDSSFARIVVRGRDNNRRELVLPRRASYVRGAWRKGDILKMLPGNIGYADLDRLPPTMVDSMFDAFRQTKGIIFDMRGYPRGTAWSIAPRLTERTHVGAASFYRPTVFFPDGPEGEYLEQHEQYGFVQQIPPTDKWRYGGKTVMLIDDRTQSQAEHSGLFYRAANGTHFVGSPTAGANGDITNFRVPGDILICFSGQGVTYPDGRQLQRVGLLPDVAAAPTIKGIREGKDEVLDAALKYLRRQLRP
jgi:C-terminal processing protease CtpA/Prc